LPNFIRKFDIKRKILLVLLSQSREPVYTLYDVQQRGNGALLTNELAESINIQPQQLVYNSRQHHGDRQLGWGGEREKCKCSTILYITNP
jgi:hypothetical protein